MFGMISLVFVSLFFTICVLRSLCCVFVRFLIAFLQLFWTFCCTVFIAYTVQTFAFHTISFILMRRRRRRRSRFFGAFVLFLSRSPLFLLLLLLRSYVCVLSSVLYSSVSRLCAYHTTFSYCCIYSLFSLVIVRLCVTFTCWFFFLLALSHSPLFAFELVCCVHCVCLYKYIAVNIHIWTGTYRAYYMFVLVQSLHCKYKLWWKKREEHREHFHVENYIFLSLLACISCISFLAFYFCSLLMHPSAISLLSVCLPSSHTYIHTFSNVACSNSRKTFPVETCHPMVFICTTAFHLFFIFCASRWFFSFFLFFPFFSPPFPLSPD